MRIYTCISVPCTGKGIGYTCEVLVGNMCSADLPAYIVTPYAHESVYGDVFIKTLPLRFFYKWDRAWSTRINEKRFLAAIDKHPDAVAYLFGETTPFLDHALATRGTITVREKVNNGKRAVKDILDIAYDRIGIPPSHGITEAEIRIEQERLLSASYVFCPNQFVEQSVAGYGMPQSKIIPTSYGLDFSRLAGNHLYQNDFPGPIFLFVGTICVRKGAHLLLAAWSKAKLPGTLVFAGKMDPEIATLCAAELALDNVQVLPFTGDIGPVYRAADVFVFPTLEEGGPQVTYEAAGCALPSIVSPMGAGRIIRDGIDGIVADPYDEEAWIDAMARMAEDEDLRASMALAGRARADVFTWDKVAAERRHQLLSRIAASHHAA